MLDPISVTSLILQIPGIAAKLYDYGKQVKDSKKEIGNLYAEILALQAVLGQIKVEEDGENSPRNQDLRNALSSESIRNTIVMTDSILKTIWDGLNKIQAPGRQALKSLAWPLARSDIYNQIAKLERLKSSFVMILMNDGL
jgi:hypothetical protein